MARATGNQGLPAIRYHALDPQGFLLTAWLVQVSDDKILACTPDLLMPRSARWLLLRHGFYSLEYPTFRTAMIFDCDNVRPNLPTLPNSPLFLVVSISTPAPWTCASSTQPVHQRRTGT